MRSFQTEIEELRKQLENATINTQTDTTPEPEHDTPSKKKDRAKKVPKKKTNPEVQSEVNYLTVKILYLYYLFFVRFKAVLFSIQIK